MADNHRRRPNKRTQRSAAAKRDAAPAAPKTDTASASDLDRNGEIERTNIDAPVLIEASQPVTSPTAEATSEPAPRSTVLKRLKWLLEPLANAPKETLAAPAAVAVGVPALKPLFGKLGLRPSDDDLPVVPGRLARALPVGNTPLGALGDRSWKAPKPIREPIGEGDEKKPSWASEKAGKAVVPLSHRVHQGLWAFRFVDRIASQRDPTSAAPVQGTVRIVATMSAKHEPPGERIELVDRAGPSGMRVLETRTSLKAATGEESQDEPFEVDPVGTYVMETRLVGNRGRLVPPELLAPQNVDWLSFEHDLYDIETLPKGKLSPLQAIVLTPHNPKGGTFVLLGETTSRPIRVELHPRGKNEPLEQASVDRMGKFLLSGRIAAFFGARDTVDVTLKLHEPPAEAIDLHYRLRRPKKPAPDKVTPGDDDTRRAKFVKPLPGGAQPEKIQSLHLMLT